MEKIDQAMLDGKFISLSLCVDVTCWVSHHSSELGGSMWTCEHSDTWHHQIWICKVMSNSEKWTTGKAECLQTVTLNERVDGRSWMWACERWVCWFNTRQEIWQTVLRRAAGCSCCPHPSRVLTAVSPSAVFDTCPLLPVCTTPDAAAVCVCAASAAVSAGRAGEQG